MFHLYMVFAAKLPDPEARNVEGGEPVSQVPPSASKSSCPPASEGNRSQLSRGGLRAPHSWEVGHQEKGCHERLSRALSLPVCPEGAATLCLGKTQQCLSGVAGREKGFAGIP